MGGTVPSSKEAEAGLGCCASPLVAEVEVRWPADFFFLGRCWPGCGEETRLGGVMEEALLCWSAVEAGGVGIGAVGWPLSWALGSVDAVLGCRRRCAGYWGSPISPPLDCELCMIVGLEVCWRP